MIVKTIFFRMVLGAVIGSVVGCNSVTTKRPLTKHPQPIDQARFEGAWSVKVPEVGGEIYYLQFDQKGVAQIAQMKWKEDQFDALHGEMIVTEGIDHNFISYRVEKDGKWPKGYHLLQYRFSMDDELIVWGANTDAFEKLIDTGVLKGRIRQNQYTKDVVLTDDVETILDVINIPGDRDLFRYYDPVMLQKITAKKPMITGLAPPSSSETNQTAAAQADEE